MKYRIPISGDSQQMVNSQSSRHMKVFSAVQLSLNPLTGYGEPGPWPTANSLSD
jgi:hypothetical protein